MSWFLSLVKPFVNSPDDEGSVDNDAEPGGAETASAPRGRGQPHPDTVVQRARAGSSSSSSSSPPPPAKAASSSTSSSPYTASSRTARSTGGMVVSELASTRWQRKLASLPAAQRKRAFDLGVTRELLEFVGEIATRPETWRDFPFEEVVMDERERRAQAQEQANKDKSNVVAADRQTPVDGDNGVLSAEELAAAASSSIATTSPWEPFELTPRRLEHALVMLDLCEPLRQLRYNLCPRSMDEDRFWRVYFALAAHRLDKPHVAMLADEPVPSTMRSVELTPEEDLSVWEFLMAPSSRTGGGDGGDGDGDGAVDGEDDDEEEDDEEDDGNRDTVDGGGGADDELGSDGSAGSDGGDKRRSGSRRGSHAADQPKKLKKKQALPVRDALPWELLAADPDAYDATCWSDSDRSSAATWFVKVREADAGNGETEPEEEDDALDDGEAWSLVKGGSGGLAGAPPPIALARRRLLLRHGFAPALRPDEAASPEDRFTRAALVALAACGGSGQDRLFGLQRFLATERRVFGPHVPERCARVPAFGGHYRPDVYADMLVPDEAAAASRVLVMLAMELPELSFAPALPDAVQLAMVGTGGGLLGASTAFAVFQRLLRCSQGAMARERLFAKQLGTGGGARALPLAADAPPLHFCLAPVEFRVCHAVLGELIRRALPDLHQHMTRVRVMAGDFADRWFKRLFVGAGSPALCERVFALWLSEGLAALYAVAMAFLRIHRAALLRCGNGDDFLNCLRQLCAPDSPAGHVNEERVLRAAFAVRLTRALLARLHEKHYGQAVAARSAALASKGSGGGGGASNAGAAGAGSGGGRRDRSASSLLRRPWRRRSRRESGAPPAGSAGKFGPPAPESPIGSRVLTSLFYRPRIRQLSTIIDQEEFEVIWSWLPDNWRMSDPLQVFSTAEHGVSISSLYKLCQDVEPTLILLKTKLGDRMGAFISYPWDPSEPSYYGSGESFVFRLQPQPERFGWRPGQQNLFQMAQKNFLAVGGNAIRLDDELWQGRSEPGKTFDNPSLIEHHMSENDLYSFQCVAVEIYTCQEQN